MASVAIVFHSRGGHTRVLAEAIAQGVRSVPGTEAQLVEILPAHVVHGRWDAPAVMSQLERCDVIVVGCATYMGSVSAVFKAFLEKAFDPRLTQQ